MLKAVNWADESVILSYQNFGVGGKFTICLKLNRPTLSVELGVHF